MTAKDSKRNKTKFLVMLALSHGDKHGYEISKFIEQKTNGFFSLPFGSLYPVLHKLEKEKLILASWENTNTQKPKKSYALSKAGRMELKDEIKSFKISTASISKLIPKKV